MEKRMRFVVFIVYFMAFLGIAMPFPIITPMIMGGGLDVPFTPETALGLSLAVYPIGLFFGGGTLGSFSDRFGRKPVLLVSLMITIVSMLWCAYAIWIGDFWQFVISRLVTGYFEASGSIARAMLVDMEKGESKSSSFALLSVGGYAGYLLGPVMAGYLAVFHDALPFLVASGMGVAALTLAAMWLPETNERVRAGLAPEKRPGVLRMIREHRLFRRLLMVHFFMTMGVNTFYQFYPLMLVKRWALDSFEIAMSNIFFTGSMIFFALVGVKRLERIMKQGVKLVSAGIIMAVLMLVNLGAMQLEVSLTIAVFLGCAVAVVNAVLPAYISRYTFGELEQGAVMGSLTSSFCLAQACISIVGSQAAILGIEYTFMLGSMAVLVGVIQVYSVRRLKLRMAASHVSD